MMVDGLKPCPFCGGEAQRLTLGEDDGPDNAGGDVICCTRCQASSHVEFGRKENLVDRWNTRADYVGTWAHGMDTARRIAIENSNHGHVEGNRRAFKIADDIEYRRGQVGAALTDGSRTDGVKLDALVEVLEWIVGLDHLFERDGSVFQEIIDRVEPLIAEARGNV